MISRKMRKKRKSTITLPKEALKEIHNLRSTIFKDEKELQAIINAMPIWKFCAIAVLFAHHNSFSFKKFFEEVMNK